MSLHQAEDHCNIVTRYNQAAQDAVELGLKISIGDQFLISVLGRNVVVYRSPMIGQIEAFLEGYRDVVKSVKKSLTK